MVDGIVRNFPWPKSMVSGVSKLRWVRPLQRILCVFDGEVVPFMIDGHVSGDLTEGHRFMGTGQAFHVKDFDSYADGLAKNFVVLDPEERKERIMDAARTLCFARNFELVEDEGLLAEVAGLAEWPTPVMGDMDPDFLDLPPEVIRTSMRVHQRFFAVRDPMTGFLVPHFITVANIEATDGGATIATGNARVLSARLSDARFFWTEDQRVKLEDRLEKLKGVTFHAKLGTMYERVERITALAGELAAYTGADKALAEQAARLCKADLGTGMVGEFPELQGIMGAYYAEKEGFEPEIVDAIRSHYRPQGPSDDVPVQAVGATVALADKLDTLVGFHAIGERATGSRDPFALRRAALGVVRVLIQTRTRISLEAILRRVHEIYIARFKELKVLRYHSVTGSFRTYDDMSMAMKEPAEVDPFFYVNIKVLSDPDPMAWIEWQSRSQFEPAHHARFLPEDDVVPGLVAFFADRLKVLLRDQGQRHDLVDAVFALGDDDIVRIVAKVTALGDFLGTEDGANLLAGYKRAVNILKAEEKKAPVSPGEPVDMAGSPPEEAGLIDAVGHMEIEVGKALEREDYALAMRELAALRPAVDAFFDKVLVNSDVPAERENRLRLLAKVRDAMGRVADFGLVTG
jgi:glycyl-tRNA synthetase beta chain